jgi:hypothetical protein
METSAKTATNVNDIFYEIGELTFILFVGRIVSGNMCTTHWFAAASKL